MVKHGVNLPSESGVSPAMMIDDTYEVVQTVHLRQGWDLELTLAVKVALVEQPFVKLSSQIQRWSFVRVDP